MDYGLLPPTPDPGQEKPSRSKKRKRGDADGSSCEDSFVVGSGTEEKMDDETYTKRKQKKKKKKKNGDLKKEKGEFVREEASGLCFFSLISGPTMILFRIRVWLVFYESIYGYYGDTVETQLLCG